MNNDVSVLYVEDDEESRKVVKFLLTREIGLSHVTIWDDSSDFQARVEQLEPKPDIVFLDIHVQPTNGIEMLKTLRSLDSFANTAIVALTASIMNEEIQFLKESGFDGAIGKPINHETFATTLNKILDGEHIWRVRY